MGQEIDPTDLGTLARVTQEQERARELKRKVEVDDFLWLVKHEQGRRLLWRLLSVTGTFRTPYRGVRDDTDFRCGEQNVGLMVLAELHELSPDSYHVMVREQQEENGSDRNSST